MRERWLYVVADDLGLSPEVDAGIIEAVRAGTVTTADLLVNPPFGADTTSILAAGASLGLHLNLTHGRPCSDPDTVPSLVTAAGEFVNRREDLLPRLDEQEAARELRRQFECFQERVGRPPSHLSVHKHLQAHDPRLLRLAAALARECGAPLRSIDAATRAACRELHTHTNDHFLGEVRPAPYWTLPRLREQAASAVPGVTELMCHPGRGGKPIAGLWYLAERDAERETFCAPEARELLSAWRLRPCTASLFAEAL